MCGLSILALTAVHGNYHGYVLFVWIYGIFCGGYHYSLKMYTYERVRARNFARTWGFVQCSQAIPIALGVPISGILHFKFEKEKKIELKFGEHINLFKLIRLFHIRENKKK